jgi:hypothetical protein
LTIDQLQQRAGSFTPGDLAQITTDAHAYAVWRGHEDKAAAYTSWYVESNTSHENAGWNNLPRHPETFAAWMVRPGTERSQPGYGAGGALAP